MPAELWTLVNQLTPELGRIADSADPEDHQTLGNTMRTVRLVRV